MSKVSVVIPIYGVEKYIERCARSLFEQTLDDIEYIFIDDCTKDASMEILKKIIKEYPHRNHQIRIEKMPINSGLPAVRKLGIQLATGNYIIHCDSDDWINLQAYEKLYNKALEGNFDIVFCDFYISNGITKKRKNRNFKRFEGDNVEEVVASNFMWSLWGAMVKRNIYNNDIIYPKSNNGEDFALMFQLMYYANSYSYVKEPLYYYYYNSQSITKEPSLASYMKRLEQHRNNVELLSTFFSRENKSGKYNNILLILKLLCRANFSVKINNEQTRKIWYSIFPELEKTSFAFNVHIPISLKINYWSVRLKIFVILKKIQRVLNFCKYEKKLV